MAIERLVLAFTSGDRSLRHRLAAAASRRGFLSIARRPGDPPAPAAVASCRYDGATIDFGGRPPKRIRVVDVDRPSQLDELLRNPHGRTELAVRWIGDRVIPLETAVARTAGRLELWVVTTRVRDVPGALGALERGADHVLVEIADASQLDELEAILDANPPVSLRWAARRISRVEPAGMGDRILVDTTSLLRDGEGMLLGSAAAFLFHVRAETEGSRYTRPRPFRINAGPPHSYTLMPDGTTRYLSELRSGEGVLVAAARSPPRVVRVGRLKVERRPLMRVECADRGLARTVFVQEAETVRLTSDRGGARPVTDLAPRHLVLGVVLPPARHLGHAVEETIDER